MTEKGDTKLGHKKDTEKGDTKRLPKKVTQKGYQKRWHKKVTQEDKLVYHQCFIEICCANLKRSNCKFLSILTKLFLSVSDHVT